MQEPPDPGSFDPPPDQYWGQANPWPLRITLGLSIACAAVAIPALSMHLDDVYHETLVMLEDAELDTVREINGGVNTPEQLRAALDNAVTRQERERIRQQLGFGPDVPKEVVERRLRSYAADFRDGRFDRVPLHIKMRAIEHFGLERLLALKQRMLEMDLTEDQMIAFAKRELSRDQ
ncbi:MAG: hypothetical protein AAF581_15610 [Planctomycetota bacterium]